jgi:hypothetical protein
MGGPDSAVAVGLLLAMQVAGLASAVLARISVGWQGHAIYRGLFLVFLAAIGLATMAAVSASKTIWLPCGFTLPAMVLAVVWDFRRDGVVSRPAN